MIGDVLTSTIIAEQFKISYPQGQVDYLIASSAAAVVEGNPFIDHIITVDDDEMKGARGINQLGKKIHQLNPMGYDYLIDVYGKLNSGLLSFKLKAEHKIGYKKWFSSIGYHQSFKNTPDPQLFKKGLSLGSRLLLTKGFTDRTDWELTPQIFLSHKEKAEARQWLKNEGIQMNKPLFMISVLGSGQEKSLPIPNMAATIDYIASNIDAQMIFNYSPHQKNTAKEIFDTCTIATQQKISWNSFPDSLRHMLSVLSHCDAIIGNEGGSINMAKALGVPSFAIFSPWINKQSWNIKEGGNQHISVHLKDYKPDLYQGVTSKEVKNKYSEFYKEFKYELYKDKLGTFVKQFNKD